MTQTRLGAGFLKWLDEVMTDVTGEQDLLCRLGDIPGAYENLKKNVV